MKNNKLRLLHPPVLCALCAAFFAYASANSALAQEWRFEPVFKVGGEVDDNATLSTRTDEEVNLTGFLADVRADIKYTSPKTSFSLQPKVVSRNYDGEAVYDSDDYFLRSDFRRQGNLGTFGFRVKFGQESVRRAERADTDLEIEDPDEFTDDDTGRVQLLGDRTQWRVSPYWDYQLSDVSTVGAAFNYVDAEYDDVFSGLLNDYSDARLSLNYWRTISNVTNWGISLTGRRYDSEDSPLETDGYGLSAVIGHSLSEKTRIRAMIGFEETDKPGLESDPEFVGGVTLTRNLQTIRLLAQYRRSISAGGSGEVLVRDALNLNFRRRLNERISAGLGVRAYQTKGASGIALDRDYVQLRSSLVWYLTQSFVVEADYRYTVQDRGENLSESANSNQVNLMFVYQPRTVPRL